MEPAPVHCSHRCPGGVVRMSTRPQVSTKAFWRTIAVLAPLGFVLDLFVWERFFHFPNQTATFAAISIPAVGGRIPIEEFVFYLTGSCSCCSVISGATNIGWPPTIFPITRGGQGHHANCPFPFHFVHPRLPSDCSGNCLPQIVSGVPDGFPWYFIYLVCASLIPSAGFFHTAQRFINWRAFSFTFFLLLLISLLWEVTLALPYGWWEYRSNILIGLPLEAGPDLPLEALCVWLAVTFTTVITYEVIKIWKALGIRALEAFFGIGK